MEIGRALSFAMNHRRSPAPRRATVLVYAVAVVMYEPDALEEIAAETGRNLIEIGATGLRVSGGRIQEEFLPQLQGIRAARIYTEMRDNDPFVSALLWGLEQEIRKADWDVEQGDATDDDAQFLDECHDDMEDPWSTAISEAATMCQFGWSWLETVYKIRDGEDAEVGSQYSDGQIGWRKMPLRSQDSLWMWAFDRPEEGPSHGIIEGMWQRTQSDIGVSGAPLLIPQEVSLHFRTSHHKNNPEGRSLCRSAYRPWYFKKRIEESEAIGVDRDLTGMPVFEVPAELLSPQASPDQQAALAEFQRIGRSIRLDEQTSIVMPQQYDDNGNPMYKFSLASVPSRRPQDTNTIINRYAVGVLVGVLADVMMLGHEQIGTQALSATKSEMFTRGIQALVDEIRDVVNRRAIPRLFRLNGRKGPYPQFTTTPVDSVDPADFIHMVLEYAQSGAPLFPDKEFDAETRERAGLPRRSQEALALDALPKPEPPVPPGASVPGGAGAPGGTQPVEKP